MTWPIDPPEDLGPPPPEPGEEPPPSLRLVCARGLTPFGARLLWRLLETSAARWSSARAHHGVVMDLDWGWDEAAEEAA